MAGVGGRGRGEGGVDVLRLLCHERWATKKTSPSMMDDIDLLRQPPHVRRADKIPIRQAVKPRQ